MSKMTLFRTGSMASALALLALVAAPAFADDAEILRRVEERFKKAGLDQDTDISVQVQD